MAAENGTPAAEHDVPERAVRQLRIGAYAAVICAEAMSSVRLFGLGEQVGFAWYLAWLLPGALDIYALTMLRFSSSVPADHALRHKAMREATLALTLTVGCNALYEAIRSFAAQLPVWAPGALFVLVSALAPFVAGRIIHFHSMVGSAHADTGSIAAPAEPAAVPHTGSANGSVEPVEPGSTATPGTTVEPSRGTEAQGSVEPPVERPMEPPRAVPPHRPAAAVARSRGTTAKRPEATVTSIVPNPEWPAMVKALVDKHGPKVPLSTIQRTTGCSKSTASRLRGEATAKPAAKPVTDADTEPEREQEAS